MTLSEALNAAGATIAFGLVTAIAIGFI